MFVALMRVQGKTKQLNEGHPVMEQIQRVKLRYMKLNEAVQAQQKAQNDAQKMRLDKEATERIVRNALGSQIKEDEERNRQRRQTTGTKGYLSSSSDSDESDGKKQAQVKETKKVAKFAKSKAISKPEKRGKQGLASRKDMHGATVVPVAAHLKYRQLLEKK